MIPITLSHDPPAPPLHPNRREPIKGRSHAKPHCASAWRARCNVYIYGDAVHWKWVREPRSQRPISRRGGCQLASSELAGPLWKSHLGLRHRGSLQEVTDTDWLAESVGVFYCCVCVCESVCVCSPFLLSPHSVLTSARLFQLYFLFFILLSPPTPPAQPNKRQLGHCCSAVQPVTEPQVDGTWPETSIVCAVLNWEPPVAGCLYRQSSCKPVQQPHWCVKSQPILCWWRFLCPVVTKLKLLIDSSAQMHGKIIWLQFSWIKTLSP